MDILNGLCCDLILVILLMSLIFNSAFVSVSCAIVSFVRKAFFPLLAQILDAFKRPQYRFRYRCHFLWAEEGSSFLETAENITDGEL